MRRRDVTRFALTVPALALMRHAARAADTDFKVGVVASVTGTFASPTKAASANKCVGTPTKLPLTTKA